jgi:lipopolysaccharide export system ATP-binding protein
MVVGLVRANKGSVLLQQDDGQIVDMTHMPMNERAKLGVGYLPQETSIFRKLNVEDNLKLVLEMNTKLSQKQKDELLETLLTEFGVKKLRHASAVALSGGERRRVEIARALAATPSFILLDEPFTGIDPIAIGEIKENIYKLAKEKNIGILITDHNPKATLSITDRANVIFDGKIKISGKSTDVAVDPVAREFYLGKDFVL